MPCRQRRSIRLPGYDYRRPGWYFVTICAHDRACLFGEVVDEAVRLGPAGRIVLVGIRALPRHFRRVVLDAFVVMPNHVHVVLGLTGDPDGEAAPATTPNPRRGEASVAIAPRVVGGDVGRPPAIVPGPADASPLPQAGSVESGSMKSDSAESAGLVASPRSLSQRPPSDGPSGTAAGSLGAVVQNLKSVTTRRINRLRRTPGGPVWQRNYWERVVRNEAELVRIRRYVRENPARWTLDRLRP